MLDCEDCALESVSINGVAVAGFTVENDKLTIAASAVPTATSATQSDSGATTPPPPPPFVLETVSTLAPATNLQLSGLYKSSGMFCTQCEAEGFRRITPYFDRPDVMTSFKVNGMGGVGGRGVIVVFQQVG